MLRGDEQQKAEGFSPISTCRPAKPCPWAEGHNLPRPGRPGRSVTHNTIYDCLLRCARDERTAAQRPGLMQEPARPRRIWRFALCRQSRILGRLQEAARPLALFL